MSPFLFFLLTLAILGLALYPQRGLSEENTAGKVVAVSGVVEILRRRRLAAGETGQSSLPRSNRPNRRRWKNAILFIDEPRSCSTGKAAW